MKVKIREEGIKLNGVWKFKGEEAVIDEEQYERNKDFLDIIEDEEGPKLPQIPSKEDEEPKQSDVQNTEDNEDAKDEKSEEEILIECKRPSSDNNVDDFTTIKFKVKEQPVIEITSFECLSNDLLVGEELVFKVGVNHQKSRTILYKFLRVDLNGKINCIQDYSTKNIVSISENKKGEYKLLCYVRDIFSNKAYDDRAAMIYSIKPYEEIKIRSFTSELSSPQLCGSTISFKASVIGGKELLYRYIVEGPVAEDSGYIRSRSFNWETKLDGEYKITLKVKDISFDGDYEDIQELFFQVDKKGERPVKILDII